MRHITPVVAVFSVLHALALTVQAGDPRAEAEAAQAQIRFAESQLERAACDVTEARARYDDIARRHAAAIADLQRAIADRDAAVQVISSAEGELPNIGQALEAARRAADGYARSIPDAEQRAAETAAALDQLRAKAFARFEASPAWANAVAAVDAAQARHDEASKAPLDALAKDETYILRLIDAMDAQAEVEVLR